MVKIRPTGEPTSPTVLPNTTPPPVPGVRVSVLSPPLVLIVVVEPAKSMFAPALLRPPLVVSIVRVAPSATGPVIVTMPPPVVRFPKRVIEVVPV